MSRMTLNTRIILEPVNVIATSCHDVGYHVTFIIVLSLQHYTCKLHHMSQNLARLACGQSGARTHTRHSGEMIEWLSAVMKYQCS